MVAEDPQLSLYLAKADNLSYVPLTRGPERVSVSRKGTKRQGRPTGAAFGLSGDTIRQGAILDTDHERGNLELHPLPPHPGRTQIVVRGSMILALSALSADSRRTYPGLCTVRGRSDGRSCEVGEREFRLRMGNADGADEEAVAVLLVGKDMFDPGVDR